MEAVLREYAAQIKQTVSAQSCCSSQYSYNQPQSVPAADQGLGKPTRSGALLFAVIGAKLSEGLNFTDDLARAVIIIGLPFANLASPELRERMNYVNRTAQRRLADRKVAHKTSGERDAATELYENMCMNSVNQSIGTCCELLRTTVLCPNVHLQDVQFVTEETGHR